MSPIRSAFTLALFLGIAACRDGTGPPPPERAAATSERSSAPSASAPGHSSTLTRVVAANTVCMVNDQYMGREQIAVPVGDKTYFGCCADCKAKLEKNESMRTGTDPVTGKPVDKASAVIGRDEQGKVFYFESEATLARYAH